MWLLVDDIVKIFDKILIFGLLKCIGCIWLCLGIKIGDLLLFEEVDVLFLFIMRMVCFDVDVMFVWVYDYDFYDCICYIKILFF